MLIKLASVPVHVEDLDKAYEFYTRVLGFEKKADMVLPNSKARWITVVSPEERDGVELLLEPGKGRREVEIYYDYLYKSGIPVTAFMVKDIYYEYDRLKKAAVDFLQEPVDKGAAITAIFDDTCGNLIEIYQPKG